MDLVTELQKEIAEFNKAKVVEIKKTYKADYKGNQNDLNKFMSRVAYLDYCKSIKKNGRKNIKKEYNQFDSANDIHAIPTLFATAEGVSDESKHSTFLLILKPSSLILWIVNPNSGDKCMQVAIIWSSNFEDASISFITL